MTAPTPEPHPLFRDRRAGVLLHPTSLPGPHGVGDLGPAARRFVDWSASAGLSIWQMLPLGPVGEGDSPYSPRSAFALEPLLASLDDLVADGLLPRSALRRERPMPGGRAAYAAARRFKLPRLRAAWESFHESGGTKRRPWRRFLDSESAWLDDWCGWIDDGRDPDFHAFVQFILATQWRRLREHARGAGVALVGDLPIFVVAASCDVATRPELFRLDRAGRPTVVTGVPPDAFSKSGQLWNHPHYAWPAHAREGFAWWIARTERLLRLFDAVRLDHFVGFVHLYEVPGGARTARRGRWRATPGAAILDALRARIGPLPIMAEDLGAVTPAVERLRDRHGLPGMRILQFGFFEDDASSAPHRHPPRCVVYPGTHDNETTRGWWRALDAKAKRRFRAYAGADDPAAAMLRICLASPANTAIIAMQDLLGLPASARMNRPGTPKGNWRWRLAAPPTAADARRIAALVAATGRAAGFAGRERVERREEKGERPMRR